MNAKLIMLATAAALIAGCGSDSKDDTDHFTHDRLVDVDRTQDRIFTPSYNGDEFLWGGATAAFQVEGEHPYFDKDVDGNEIIKTDLFGTQVYKYGKSASKWSIFSQAPIDRGFNMTYGERAYTAIDQYHRYEDDLDLMQSMNINSYRFSIAWTRIIPNDGADLMAEQIGIMANLPDRATYEGADQAGYLQALSSQLQSNDATIAFDGSFIRHSPGYYADIAQQVGAITATKQFDAEGKFTHSIASINGNDVAIYLGMSHTLPIVINDGQGNSQSVDIRITPSEHHPAGVTFILPAGWYPINYHALKHYSNLIEALQSRGMSPIVTMYHWDMPVQLWYYSFRAWGDRTTLDYFQNYADVLLSEYGQEVPYWLTINEPFSDACVGDGILGGVISGKYSIPFISTFMQKVGFNIDILANCVPLVHNVFTAHARVTDMFNQMQDGSYVSPFSGEAVTVGDSSKLGIVIGASPAKPATDSPEDLKAAEMYDRVWERMWLTPFMFADNVIAHSDYADMPYTVESDYQHDSWALEYFKEYEAYLVKEDCVADLGAYHSSCRAAVPYADLQEDWRLMGEVGMRFIGVNYYTRWELSMTPVEQQNQDPGTGWYNKNQFSRELGIDRSNGESLGMSANGSFDPMGLYQGLTNVSHEFPNADIMITETGAAYFKERDGTNQESISDENVIDDYFRIRFLKGMTDAVWKAKEEDGVKITGMMPWSTFDNFEWTSGTDNRFGLVHIDYDSPELTRYMKKSAHWYKEMIEHGGLKAEQ